MLWKDWHGWEWVLEEDQPLREEPASPRREVLRAGSAQDQGASPESDAHLNPILGKEGTRVRLHGKLEAGGITPEGTAAEE